MKKMPTLFRREFKNHEVVKTYAEVTPGCEWGMRGEGVATEKVDGAACAIIDGVFYRRYDAKKGQKRMRDGAIPCQEAPDPVTGHWPFWVPVDTERSEDKWFARALENTKWVGEDGTYEAVGPHFQTNPYGLDEDFIERHGRIEIKNLPRTYKDIKEYLREHEIEGIVWHRGNGEMCKIKRTDFGYAWPVKWEDVCE